MRELVTVSYFDDEIKAQSTRLALEEAGIRVWAGSAPQPNWDSGVKLQVEREDEQAARKVLTDRSPVVALSSARRRGVGRGSPRALSPKCRGERDWIGRFRYNVRKLESVCTSGGGCPDGVAVVSRRKRA